MSQCVPGRSLAAPPFPVAAHASGAGIGEPAVEALGRGVKRVDHRDRVARLCWWLRRSLGDGASEDFGRRDAASGGGGSIEREGGPVDHMRHGPGNISGGAWCTRRRQGEREKFTKSQGQERVECPSWAAERRSGGSSAAPQTRRFVSTIYATCWRVETCAGPMGSRSGSRLCAQFSASSFVPLVVRWRNCCSPFSSRPRDTLTSHLRRPR